MPNHPGIAIVLISGLLTAGALAQETIDPNLNGSDKEPLGKAIQPVAPPSFDLLKAVDLHVDYSWVPQSNLGSSAAFRKVTEQTLQVGAAVRLKISDRLSLSIGGEYEDFFFSFQQPNRLATFPLFHNLGVVGAKAGFVYELSPQWSILGNVAPSFNGDLNNLTARDFVMGGMLALKYSPYGNDKLFFLLGANVHSTGQVPVLPVAGVRWQVTEALTLNLTVPRPEIDYDVTRRITLFADASFNGGDFRVPNNAGSAIGQPKFNNAWLSYESIRFGGGLRLKILSFASLQAEGGYEAERNFNFGNLNNNNGINTHVKSAPYIETRLNISF
ncbi:MAG TPA: DUF6268 family outer membrane beta-barrel protein [Chthoniobacterales bacterium]|nr:DUF6268 family outer membrane beta-barrel protein [Chthoniobacterales bacterium]